MINNYVYCVKTEINDYNNLRKYKQFIVNKGKIQFNNLSFKYRNDLPNVLNNISFTISPGETIGVCGRTGAGKSSLILCLMRLFAVEYNQIFIDDVDINKISPYDLRSNISVIPQMPTIFNGTIRFNLDPFNQLNDNQLINALKLCYLYREYNDLDFVISENGNNLSQGQKQLLCIARCVVRNTKILLFDEYTANIDSQYDQLIQAVIRHNFRHCTILTIAHRLHTIINNDKILVLDNGKIIQFDTPNYLLKNKNGMFYKLYNNK